MPPGVTPTTITSPTHLKRYTTQQQVHGDDVEIPDLGERDKQTTYWRDNDDADQPEWYVLRPEPNLPIRRAFDR